ncbi:MAG: hypothetical protein ACOYA9_00265 [Bilifractor sp.]|jgi:uncharacterized ubiquitin-like protein YukD
MKITITVRNKNTRKSYDIALDNRQKIATTIQVLRECLPRAMEGIGEKYEIRSERTGRRLSAEDTYERQQIFTGDALLVNSLEG